MAKRKDAVRRRMKRASGKYFEDQRALFAPLVSYASLVSNRIGPHVATPPRGYATWLFMRACVTARSILKLCELQETQYGVSYLDHASVASLSRALIENIAVVRYIGDVEISEDEWNCRKSIVDVHDCVNRTEFLRLLGGKNEDENVLKRLQARLTENSFFKTLKASRQRRLLNGEDMFIDGRHRSMLVFGWGDDHTRGIYKYLSHQSHSLSMAFHRTQDNDLYAPNSQYARAIAGGSIDWARHALGYGVLHMVSLFPYVEAAFDAAVFQGLKSQYAPNEVSRSHVVSS